MVTGGDPAFVVQGFSKIKGEGLGRLEEDALAFCFSSVWSRGGSRTHLRRTQGFSIGTP